MSNCNKYQILIDKYLAADINDRELAELESHCRQCPACREQFERIGKTEHVVTAAYASATAAKQASDSVLPKLTASRPKSASKPLFPRQMAAAAGVLLGIGFLIGFGSARVSQTEQPATRAAQVPMKVAELTGTVLVRHEDSDVWKVLEAGSNLYLGDTFHSTAKSACVVELGDKSTLELTQNSMLVLRLYNGGTEFFLKHGVLAAALKSPHGPFFISTPHGRVEALGTEFTVTVE